MLHNAPLTDGSQSQPPPASFNTILPFVEQYVKTWPSVADD
jgi:hypothetical protein